MTDETVSYDAIAHWVRSAMRFVDLCDADVAGYDEMHHDAAGLLDEGFALFGIDVEQNDEACLADLEGRALAIEKLDPRVPRFSSPTTEAIVGVVTPIVLETIRIGAPGLSDSSRQAILINIGIKLRGRLNTSQRPESGK
jgi:hypothetical protein